MANRVSHVGLEVLRQSGLIVGNRVSHVGLEVLRQNAVVLQPVRLSQAAFEVLDAQAGSARSSQLAVEVLKQRPVTTFVGLSQLTVEVLVPVQRRARFWVQIV